MPHNNTHLAPIREVRNYLMAPEVMEQIATALPKHMTAERMLRVALTAIQKTPKLRECSKESIIGAVVEASQLGLEPDGALGQAWLLPFYNKKTKRQEAQLMIGYRGLIELARRSARVKAIWAEVVYEADQCEVTLGLSPSLVHVPNWSTSDPGKVIGAYAVAEFDEGVKQFVYLPRRDIDARRSRSKSGDYGPWETDYPEMAKKSAVKSLAKYLPLSPEVQMAVMNEERIEVDVPPERRVVDPLDVPPAAQIAGPEPGGDFVVNQPPIGVPVADNSASEHLPPGPVTTSLADDPEIMKRFSEAGYSVPKRKALLTTAEEQDDSRGWLLNHMKVDAQNNPSEPERQAGEQPVLF